MYAGNEDAKKFSGGFGPFLEKLVGGYAITCVDGTLRID
jgi:hypothetical protein